MAEEIEDWVAENWTAEDRAEFILEAAEDAEVRDELARRFNLPLGLSRDEILDRLLAIFDYTPVDGESQHG